MRKLAIVVTALACLSLMAIAATAATAPAGEDMKGKVSIDLMGGLSVPTGKLAAKPEDDGADMKLGWDFGGGLDYFVTKEVAVGVDASYSQMKSKEEEVDGVKASSKAKTMEFGIHGKYFIPTGGPVTPYLQLGFGMYNRKAEFSASEGGLTASISVSDTKPGVNGGVGVDYKVNEMFGIGLNGAYHMSIGKFEPEIAGEKVELLKDWQYVTFNAALTYYIPMGK